MFQKMVNRSYTAGFPGQISHAGPYRAKPARITSASGNVMSRAFGVNGEVAATGTTQAAQEVTAEVGGAVFLGLLGWPQHYALYGTQSGGPLAPADELPQYAEGEFFDMVTGMTVELFNETTAAKTVNYGDSLAYAPKGISAANNPQGIPIGGLISVAPGAAVPTGFVAIPNSRVRNATNIAASAAGAPVSTYTNVQLTQ